MGNMKIFHITYYCIEDGGLAHHLEFKKNEPTTKNLFDLITRRV